MKGNINLIIRDIKIYDGWFFSEEFYKYQNQERKIKL